MEISRQLSVTLVNKPGRMAAVLDAISKAKVNVLALAIMDSGGRGRLRLIADRPKAAEEAIASLNVNYDTSDVLLLEMPHQPGAFAKICQRLSDEHLNIDYAYSSFGAVKGSKYGALAVIKVNDLSKAQRLLAESAASNQRGRRPGRRPVHAR